MIRRVALLCALVAASEASALSCLEPNVIRAFNEAAASDKSYVVLHGTFSFDPAQLPTVNLDRQQDVQPDNLIKARFIGESLTGRGFFLPTSRRDVTLNAQCFGPWCASLSPDTPYLAFVEKTKDGFTLAVSPCGGRAFANPSREQLLQVSTCFKGGPCAEQTPLR